MNNAFLSHTSADKPFVEKLALDLKNAGINVWFDAWEIAVGDSIVERINAALSANDCLVLVLSPRAVESRWVQRELNASLMHSLSERKVKILPALYENCIIPSIIADLKYADFRTDYDSGLRDILNSILSKKEKYVGTDKIKNNDYLLQITSLRSITTQDIEKKRQEIKSTQLFDLGEFEKDEEVGPSILGTRGLVRYYKNGLIVWHDYGKRARKAFVVYGGIGDRFRNLVDRWEGLGFPINDEEDTPQSPFGSMGRYSLFEGGVILWYGSGSYREQTYAISGLIARKYNSLGLSVSYLGFPISEPYRIRAGKRCDFEGGSILFLNSSESTHIVRQLLRIDYLDSPLNHEWLQYGSSDDLDCLSVRPATRIGKDKSFIAFNTPWGERGIRFPDHGFQADELREKYCGVTVKSLVPGSRVRFYLKVKTNARYDQYLEFDSEIARKELVSDSDKVEYWRVPLPTVSTDGEMHTYVIDLDSHIQEGFIKTFESLERFHFRGHLGIADLFVSHSREALEEIAINPIRV